MENIGTIQGLTLGDPLDMDLCPGSFSTGSVLPRLHNSATCKWRSPGRPWF